MSNLIKFLLVLVAFAIVVYTPYIIKWRKMKKSKLCENCRYVYDGMYSVDSRCSRCYFQSKYEEKE